MSIYSNIKEEATYKETLTDKELVQFNKCLNILQQRLRIEGINQELLDLHFDGERNPLPFPDLHWELTACWFVVDGTLPSPITLQDGSTIDYQAIILRDPILLARWQKKVAYARTGFRLR